MRRPLFHSSPFNRNLRNWMKSHPGDAARITATLALPEADAFHPSLRTHKLRGLLAGNYSCSVAYDLRIVFQIEKLEGTEVILLASLGTHDGVY